MLPPFRTVPGLLVTLAVPALLLVGSQAVASPRRAILGSGVPDFLPEAELAPHGDLGIGGIGGDCVSVSGDTAFVGHAFGGTPPFNGAVYVFERSGTTWSLQQTLSLPWPVAARLPPPPGDFFGQSVSVSGDTALVGAPQASLGGSVFVYVRSGGVWSLQQTLVASDATQYGYFGYSVSLEGDTALVGANTVSAAYVFVRSGTAWSEQQKLVPTEGPNGGLGQSVSVSGDTALVGAPHSAGTGAAYVFVRSGTVWSEQQKLVASDGALGNQVGTAVSVSGDTAVVGSEPSSTEPGAAYVFVRSGTSWSEQQKLVASDGAAGDAFGGSISLSGDTVVVGAHGDDTPNGTNSGSAYVFVRSGSAWNEEQRLQSFDGQAYYGGFGQAVSIEGDTLLASGADAAWSFVRSGTTWGEEQKLTGPDSPAGDFFGYSVSVSGTTAAVGAPMDNVPAGRTGTVYAFVRSRSDWSEEQKLVASDGAAEDRFGLSIAVSGDTMVIGALGHDTTAGADAGSAYVFVRSGGVWTEEQELVASDAAGGDAFGLAVAISGDTVVVGAVHHDTPGGVNAGSAYVFVRSGGVWTEEQELVASDGAAGTLLGYSVSVSGDTAVVGTGLGPGAAYVFVRSGVVWSEEQKLIPEDNFGAGFGNAVAVSGDTALVGSYGDYISGNFDQGSAYVFVRSGTVWTEQQRLLASDGDDNDFFGASVSVSGDTAMIGAPGDATGDAEAGSAYVYTRSGTVWSEDQKLVPPDGYDDDEYGNSVTVSGDTAVAGAFGHQGAYVYRQHVADLVLTETDGQASAVPGEAVTYTIVASNAGPDPASGATVLDPLPAALTDATWTCAPSPGAACTPSGSGSISDSTVLLPAASQVTYTLTATIDPGATGTLTNTASVTAPPGVPDPNPANDSATDTDTLVPAADLQLQVFDLPDPAGAGGHLTYTVQVTNLGPSTSTGMTVTDVLPADVSFVAVTPGPPACTEASGTVTCGLPGLAPNASQSVAISVGVSPSAPGPISNTATVAGSEADPVSGNDSETEPTAVGPKAEGELLHGASIWADLASAGGLPDEDLFRIHQDPRSSYAVLVDATSGDIGTGQGPELDRLALDGTVLQSSVGAGAGASRSLRFANSGGVAIDDQYVRVRSGGCTTSCGPDAVYRIRAWDTTLRVPRFNNSGTQITVLVLQNAGDAPVTGEAQFWDTAGTPVGTETFALGPREELVVNTASIPGLAGVGGSITLSHDAPYGVLTGKAVAVEPATGFTFDTALEPRMR